LDAHIDAVNYITGRIGRRDSMVFYGEERAQFPVDTTGAVTVRPVDRKNVNLSVLTKLADYLSCTPVEPKGYKKMINLPDWLVWHSIPIKSKKRFPVARCMCRKVAAFQVSKKRLCAIRFNRPISAISHHIR
jgi:hypothetical protein